MAQLIYCSGGAAGVRHWSAGALDQVQRDAPLSSAPNTRRVAFLRPRSLSWDGGAGGLGWVGGWAGLGGGWRRRSEGG